MKSAILLFFAIGVIATTQGRTTLWAETGDVTLLDGEDILIRVPKGKVIVLELRSLDASSSEVSLRLQDGQFGKIRTLRRRGSYVYRTTEDKYVRAMYTPLPYQFTTVTRKAFIEATGFDRSRNEGFVIHYTSYYIEGGCYVDDLTSDFSDEEVTCNVDSLSPVATNCDVTLTCGDNYVQNSQSKQCVDGKWTGNVLCGPRRELVDACEFDFDNLEAPSQCPYTDSEIAKFYIENENMDGVFEAGLGRSSGRSIDCRPICQNRGMCRRNRRNIKMFIKCFICVRRSRCTTRYASNYF